MKNKKLSKIGKIIIITIFLVMIILINPIKLYKKIKLSLIGYSNTSIKYILQKGFEQELFSLKYNKTINKTISNKDFYKKNYKIYLNLDYYDHHNFLKNNNKLIKLGYSIAEINLINKVGIDEDITTLTTYKHIDNISKYLKLDYAKLKNIKRYYDYELDNGLSSLEAVIDVNIGLDQEFYTNPKAITDFSYDMLINKYNYVDKDYKPKDLTKIDKKYSINNDDYASSLVVDNFIKMADAMAKENLYILANSTYRTFEDQNSIHEDYKNSYGLKAADNYAARAGFSEHQTGLCIDVANRDRDLFQTTKEYTYMKDNAYKFGFILRYPKGKENITGYKFEAWHFRYLGEELATKVYNSKLTYDEYYIMYLDK